MREVGAHRDVIIRDNVLNGYCPIAFSHDIEIIFSAALASIALLDPDL